MVLGSFLISFFYIQLSSFSSTTYLRDCLFSFIYSCLLCHRLTDHMCVGLILGFLSCSTDLFLFFVPRPYCFDDYSFVVQSEFREPHCSSSIFLSQDGFGYSVSFVLPNFKIFCSSSVKDAIGNLIGIAMNL